jgi:putative peptide zinc metalloprotease protein
MRKAPPDIALAATAPRQADAAPARLRCNLRHFPPQEHDPEARHVFHDPGTDLSYRLGARETLVARAFDGRRSHEDIRAHLANAHGLAVGPDALARFESRLLSMGVLERPGATPSRALRDPALGISYGPLKQRLMVTVLDMDAQPMLDRLHARAPWLRRRVFVLAGLLAVLAAAWAVASRWDAFLAGLRQVYGGGPAWLAWHYGVVVASIFCHEIGHGLACRHYRVRITDFGIAVYLLLATGWARPLQSDWETLDRRRRLVCIAMGPFASLLFAAAGAGLWLLAGAGPPQAAPDAFFAAMRTLGLVMAASACAALVPTLLPMFNGDTYLALVEFAREPELRQRAWRWWRARRGAAPSTAAAATATARQRRLYLAVIAGTALGWIVMWVLLARWALLIARSLFA